MSFLGVDTYLGDTLVEIQEVTPNWLTVKRKPRKNGFRIIETQVGVKATKTKPYKGSWETWIKEMGTTMR